MKTSLTHRIIYIILIIFLVQYLILHCHKKLNLNIKIEQDTIINYITLNNKNKISITNKNIDKIIQAHSKKFIFLKKNNLNTNNKYILLKQNKKLILLNKKNFSKIIEKKIIGKITSNIKITNNEIFINTNDNKIMAFDIKKNEIKWQTITNANTFNITTKSKILVSCDKIYQIIPNASLFILDKSNGEILLNKNIKISAQNNLTEIKTIKKAIINKNLIFICYKDGSFIKLDATTGEKLWQKNKNNYKNFLLTKNRIIIAKKNGNVTILNKKNGEKILTNRSLNGKKINIKQINQKLNIAIIKENSGITHLINIKNGIIIYSFKLGKNNIKYISKNNNLIGLKENKKIFNIKINS